MSLMRKLRKRYQQWRFYRHRPDLAELHSVLRVAVQNGKNQRKEP